MGFFYFLREKKFYLHLLLAIMLTIILLWAVLKSLDSYTRHGEVYIVPDFIGDHHQMLESAYGAQFNFVVIDSIFQKDTPNGTVIMQNPSPGSKVKQGRNVYLTIIAQMPEQVPMPNLRNLSLRQAVVTLGLRGLYINELFFVDHFARNAIVEQELNGEVIEPETLVFKGTAVDLIIGNGGSFTNVPIPFLIGARPMQVKSRLHAASLNLGEEYYLDGYDTLNARVYRTMPDIQRVGSAPMGERIDVYYRIDYGFDFDLLIERVKNDSINADSLMILYNDFDF